MGQRTEETKRLRFTIGQIAVAADVSAETIRQWFKRKILTTGMKGAKDGAIAREFTFETALLIAVMGRLITIGIAPRQAFRAALEFAHTGDQEGRDGAPGRNPGHLFPEGETVAVVGTIGAAIVNVSDKSQFAGLLAELAPLTHAHSPLAFLPLDILVDVVRGRLGLPRDPLTPPAGVRAAGYAHDV